MISHEVNVWMYVWNLNWTSYIFYVRAFSISSCHGQWGETEGHPSTARDMQIAAINFIWWTLNSALCHLGLCSHTSALLKLAETLLNTLVPLSFLSCLLMVTPLNFLYISNPTTGNNATWRASRCHVRSLLLWKQKPDSSQNASCGPSYANPDLQPAGSEKYAMSVGSLLPKPWPPAFWEELLRLLQWKEGWNWKRRYWGNIQTIVMSLSHSVESSSTLMHHTLERVLTQKSSTQEKRPHSGWLRSRVVMLKMLCSLNTWSQLKDGLAFSRATNTVINWPQADFSGVIS